MSHRDSSGLRYLDQLRIGFDELEYMQSERHERARLLRLAQSFEPGWIGRTTGGGQQDYGWKIAEAGSTAALRFQTAGRGATSSFGFARLRDPAIGAPNSDVPFMGIDNRGNVLEVRHQAGETVDGSPMFDSAGAQIVVPDDGVWYTLVAKYGLSPQAYGKLNLAAGSNTITGDATQFLRQNVDPPRSTRFRIAIADTLNGNEGTYEFVTITDDVNATITPAPPASETGVQFRVVGEFFTGSPADPDIQLIPVVHWELRARTVVPQADGALIAFDVMLDTGTDPNVNIHDRRRAQTHRAVSSHSERSYKLLHTATTPIGTLFSAPGGNNLAVDAMQIFTGALDVAPAGLAMAPSRGGSDLPIGRDNASCALLIAQEDGSPATVTVREFIPWRFPTLLAGGWRNPGGGGVITIPVTAGELGQGAGLDLLTVPRQVGNTHLAFFAGSDGLSLRATTDDGATWGGQSIIMPPPALEVMGDPSAVLTRFGRIVLVFTHDASGTGGDLELRYIFSDDYGVSWDINGGPGYTIMAVGGIDLDEPSIAEDDLGNLWTAFRRSGGGPVAEMRLVQGGDLNDPVPVDDLEGWIIGPSSSFQGEWANSAPSVIACPGGQVIVLSNTKAGAPSPYNAPQYVSATYGVRKVQLDAEVLARVEDANTSSESWGLTHCRLPDGRIIVAFNDPANDTLVIGFRCDLVTMSRTHESFGR